MEVGKKKWKLLLNIYHLSAPSKEIGFFNSIMFVILDLHKHNFFEKNGNWESRWRVMEEISLS